MRNLMSMVFSLFMIGLGLLSIVWVSSSSVGRVHSQQPSGLPPAPEQGQMPATDIPPPSMDIPPPAMEVQGEPAATGQVENPPPVFQNAEGYTYDPSGRRDPFHPFGLPSKPMDVPVPVSQAPNQMPSAPSVVALEPLQQFDVAQLRVVGIIWEVRNPKAMVRDPMGKLHMIVKEAKIGRNNGFVAAIREGEVIVVEPSVNESGMQTASTRVMTLAR